MDRTQISNIADISTLAWIKPSLFINHANLDGDYENIEATDSIVLNRSGYTADENLFVMYLQNAITVVENYLPFDLQAKDYQVYKDPCLKFEVRGRVDTTKDTTIYYNDFEVPSEDIKLVDNTFCIKELDDSGDNDCGSYIKINYTVESVDPEPDVLQAILMVFTYLNENKGDCSGDLCGIMPVKQVLRRYKRVYV